MAQTVDDLVEALEDVVGAAGEVLVAKEVVRVAEVEHEVRGQPDAVVPKHVGKEHLCDALHAEHGVVGAGGVDEVGRESQLVAPRWFCRNRRRPG